MKIRKNISIIMSAILMSFVSFNSISVSAAEAVKVDNNFKVDVKNATDDKGNIFNHLEWTDLGKGYSYTIHSKEASETEFQSIPAKGSEKDHIKVLNVYPYPDEKESDSTKEETFTNWKGETSVVRKSARLKKWMEEPQKDIEGLENGYGKGIIDVDAVNIDKFNSDINDNKLNILKNDNGTWKYDVIMFGSWDSNASRDLNEASMNLTQEFIKSGRGVLFGHDTLRTEENLNPNFRKLFESQSVLSEKDRIYTGIESVKDSYPTIDSNLKSNVIISKTGLLTNYPWAVGKLNDVLEVAATHNTQAIKGDAWLRFKCTDYDMNSASNFYLTTWNNTAMIQTGHTKDTATEDEKKLLANTLFYLAQVTNDTKWDDHKGQDVAAPTKPEIDYKNVKFDKNTNVINISFNAVEDLGTKYDYYVEATEKGTNKKINSNTQSIMITSGIKGYSIVVDKNKDTVPKNEVTTTDTNYTIDNNFDGDFYVHVAAIDNANNISGVSTYHYSEPTLKLTPNTTEKVRGSVIIKAEASSDKGIASIKTPDGKIVEGNSTDFTVTKNGTYTFEATDKEGHKTPKSIEITNILSPIVLNVEPNKDNVYQSDNFTVDLTIDNIKDIYATETIVNYDSSKLNFLGFEKVNGIELVQHSEEDGTITLMLMSLGAQNPMIGKTTLLKMNFRAAQAGKAKIDVNRGTVADETMERELLDEECGHAVVNIYDREFTLKDLATIGKHLGEDPKELLKKGIDIDLNNDGKVDKADYDKCSELILKNPSHDYKYKK